MQSDICMALLAAVGYYTAVRCEQFVYLLRSSVIMLPNTVYTAALASCSAASGVQTRLSGVPGIVRSNAYVPG